MGRQCTCSFKMLKENNSVQFKSADRMKYIFTERWNSLSAERTLAHLGKKKIKSTEKAGARSNNEQKSWQRWAPNQALQV